MLIVITTAITYTSYSMDQVTQLAETIGVQQEIKTDKINESFDVVSVRTDDSQFNMTVKNTGDVPVHLTRLWIENTTDASWKIKKYDIDYSLAPGNSTKNIGQDIGLFARDDQSYHAQIVSERGNKKEMFLNAVGDSSVFLRLSATPAVMPTTFSTTVSLEVINTGTTQLLNLVPYMEPPVTSACTSCELTLVTVATPSSFDSLRPGDTAIFEWVYSFSGANGDTVDFTAGLTNDDRRDTFSVALQTIESALNAEVAIESGGLGDQVLIDDDILLFHLETTSVDSGTVYEMWSGIGDGGGNGDRIQLESEIPHFYSNNGSNPITIPAGEWSLALMLSAEPMPTSLKHSGQTEHDMIFHFEDGDGVAPDNSEGQSNRDLDECGVSNYNKEITSGSDDSEERISNGDVRATDSDIEFAFENNDNTNYMSAVRFTNINIPQGTIVSSSEIVFQSDEDDSDLINLIIYGESIDDTAAFTNTAYEISTKTTTTATVAWDNIGAWSSNEVSADTTTPDLSVIVQEIVDRPGWVSGNSIIFIFKDKGDSVGQRAAEAEDSNDNPAPTMSITWGNGAVPDWRADEGPHESGTYYFDGIQECFRSKYNVSDANGNRIDDLDNTTTLWFKTDGAVTSEQYLVDFSESDGTGSDDYYRIGLTPDPDGGKIFFEYDSSAGGTEPVRCESTLEYDDDAWYHIVASRDVSGDECRMNIKDISGVEPENEIFVNKNYGGDDHLHADGQWHVAANKLENDKFFRGYIDDIIHWNEYELSGTEIDEIARVNYGTGAHEFDVTLDLTDAEGVFISNLYQGFAQKGAFADPKDGGDNDDWAYSQVNMTFTLPLTVIGDSQRLDLYIDHLPSHDNWVELEVDMKIDDTDMNNPYPSFMQIPFPDRPFPSYYVHDQDDEFQLIVTNTGTDGVFFTYQGTRVNFNGTNGAYAGLIHSVNGTGGGTGANDWWNLNEDRDSMYIPPGEIARMYFHEATNVPSENESGTLMPVGSYRTTIWLNGYSDQGETFSRSVVVGSVTVDD